MTVRRMKSYTGQTGYVYQYYFVGKRPALPNAPESPAFEYVFDVTADREKFFAVSIFLRDEALSAWATAHGRGLSDAEQYAAVKLRLFAAFDDVDQLQASERRFSVGSENIQDLLDSLDLG
ncbi:MAG TPA: hypothetical protein VD837_08790 [Terriglobales bacterium]|nr:hypothetical protein [Terriglobales bacterium]